MSGQSLSPDAKDAAEDRRTIERLLVFFALVYVVEGFGQVVGLIAQPLSFYLKEAHGWTALQVSAYLTIFNFPWIIKPIYGAFSDFVPLFGYRRKPYLLGANVVAAGAFFWVTQLTAPDRLFWALELTAYAMAISSTVCGAVLVENGQRLGESGRFVNQQWLWFNAATMVASIVGGELTQRLSPAAALHIAAAIVAVAPLAVLFGTIFLIPDKKTPIDLPALRATFGGLVTAFKRRELWIVGLFLFLYYFNPGLSTPLYYYMTDDLKFSQSYIGILGSIGAGGWVVGALLYRRLFGGVAIAAPSESQHRARHPDDGGVCPARRRDLRRDPGLLQRICRHAGDRRHGHARGRLLSAALGRIQLCGDDVDHQSVDLIVRHLRSLPVRSSLSQWPGAAHSLIRGVHRRCLPARAAPASRRQAARAAGRGGGRPSVNRTPSRAPRRPRRRDQTRHK